MTLDDERRLVNLKKVLAMPVPSAILQVFRRKEAPMMPKGYQSSPG
jgi:hypothetical protein